MKGTVKGLKHSLEGNFVDIVFHKRCKSIEEIHQAVEDAFEAGADMVIIER